MTRFTVVLAMVGTLVACGGDDDDVVGDCTDDGSAPTHVSGVKVFYGAGGSYPIPLNRAVLEESSDGGTVWLFEVPPTGAGQHYYAQVWGFLDEDAAALGADGLTLIAEHEMPVYADSANSLNALPTEGPFAD